MENLIFAITRGVTYVIMTRPLTVTPLQNGWREHHMLRGQRQKLHADTPQSTLKNTLIWAFKSCNRGGKKVVTDRSVTVFRGRACVGTSVLCDRLQLFLVTDMQCTLHNSLIIKSVTRLQLLPI